MKSPSRRPRSTRRVPQRSEHHAPCLSNRRGNGAATGGCGCGPWCGRDPAPHPFTTPRRGGVAPDATDLTARRYRSFRAEPGAPRGRPRSAGGRGCPDRRSGTLWRRWTPRRALLRTGTGGGFGDPALPGRHATRIGRAKRGRDASPQASAGQCRDTRAGGAVWCASSRQGSCQKGGGMHSARTCAGTASDGTLECRHCDETRANRN